MQNDLEWIEATPRDVVVREVEEREGGTAIPGRFLDCVLEISGQAGRSVAAIRAGQRMHAVDADPIRGDRHEVVIRGMSLHPHGNAVPGFHVGLG